MRQGAFHSGRERAKTAVTSGNVHAMSAQQQLRLHTTFLQIDKRVTSNSHTSVDRVPIEFAATHVRRTLVQQNQVDNPWQEGFDLFVKSE